MSDDEQQSIEVQSGVSVFTHEPYVQLRWGAESGQLTPAEAREHALGVLRAADAAEFDATVWAEMTETIGLEPESVVRFLAGIRERGQR